MLALRQVAGASEEGSLPSSASTRAGELATQAAPARSEPAGPRSESKGHQAGDVVDGRYVLIEPLGKGGMGVVWKARSTALDVEVAVKLVRGSTPSAEAFKRMAREAHAAARLGHPAVAAVRDFGATPNGDPYVVMELLHGESLGEVLGRERRIETLRAVGLLLPIMDGLREAHDKGIVHRDLKPENLFLAKTARGRLQPKILDFGIAKLEQQVDSTTRLTQDGTVLGSPGYFSPEQARGETDIDFRTDVWSICVVLYELITGELPFTGPNYNALLMSILRDAPKPITNDGYGDEALWEILERGLQRDRDQRWSSMWELGRALAAWLHAKGVRADAASRSLEEVWLEARPSEQAPPPAGFAQQGTRRRVLSTLIKRRPADTLAGETISTVNVQRLMATRVLGWAGAAMGVGAIGWSLLTHSSSSPAPHGPPVSAPIAATAQPNTVRPPEATPPAPAPRLSPPIASALPDRAPAQQVKDALMGAKSAPAPVVEVHSKNVERVSAIASPAPSKAAPVQHSVKLMEAPAPHHMSAPSASVVASRAKPAGRKSIDQEFGF